jgi:hypothetical protein
MFSLALSEVALGSAPSGIALSQRKGDREQISSDVIFRLSDVSLDDATIIPWRFEVMAPLHSFEFEKHAS